METAQSALEFLKPGTQEGLHMGGLRAIPGKNEIPRDSPNKLCSSALNP